MAAPVSGEVIVTVGVVVVAALTTTVAVVRAVAPWLSVTVAVMVFVPAVEYTCDAVAPATTVPSPKSMLEEAMAPSASLDAAVDAVTVTGAVPDAGVTESAATGGWFEASTITVAVVLAVPP